MKTKGGGPIAFKRGETIITEGAPGKEMFIVEEGKVEIFRQAGSDEKRMNILEMGDFFGEMSIIDDLPRGASARAHSDCKLLAVDHSTFDQMLRRYPDVAIRMLRKMSARVRELQAELEEKSADQAPKARKGASTAAPAAPARVAPSSGPAFTSAVDPIVVEMPPVLRTSAPAPSAAVSAVPTVPPPHPDPGTPGVPRNWRLVLFDTGEVFPLPEGADIHVGRFDSVAGVHPEIDLAAADAYKTTSRRHAKFVCDGGRVVIKEEIGTANGTFVNGKRIETGAEVELAEGDWIQFGGVKTILKAS
ncbi:MAG: cyclic nucleotide-binding domain-containing protein [Thermoanaerobaculia bacterium]